MARKAAADKELEASIAEPSEQPVAVAEPSEAAEAEPAAKPARARRSSSVRGKAAAKAEAAQEAEGSGDTAPAGAAEDELAAASAADIDAEASEGSGESAAARERTDEAYVQQKKAEALRARRQAAQERKATQQAEKKNGQQDKRQQRRQREQQAKEITPTLTAEDLEPLKIAEIREKADELGIAHDGLKKPELIEAVVDAAAKAEGFVEVEGVLDVLSDGYGFLRTQGYLPSEGDAYVGMALIRRNGLRKGDFVAGVTRPARQNEKYAAIQTIRSVNGIPIEEFAAMHRIKFADLTPVYPDERLIMEHGKSTITARVIDLVAPIGKGQRGLIVSPPKAGKTTVLKDIAAAITANNPEVHLMCLLVDERPEEVTDMERSIHGEVISSTFDMPSENHIAVAELVIERAKRLVEHGVDVVILLDSITRLARAYNLAQPASGRVLSGGVDSTALYPPKRFLGAARNIEHGGSLTILGTALIDTGSKMDEVIFEEFKGTGNMELKLDRMLADRRIFPAIDPITSGTRKEELLLDPQEAPLIWALRRILANMNNTERAMDTLIKSLKQTDTNQEFLIRTAKKAQSSRFEDTADL